MGDSIVNKLQKELDGLISKSKEERKKALDKIEELLRGHFGVQPQPQQQQPSKLIPSERNILEPENEDEIVSIVKDAYKNSKIVRVIGANHSWDRTISDPANTKSVVLISLTKLRGVEIDESKGTATAWAGTNIGRDPQNKDSTLENSLVYQLDQRGYALPELGGIIHQTVGGFISTGSAGGSIFHSFSEAIIHIRLIDGTGNIHDLKEDEPKFLAAGVSMGLLGIITKVTFKLEKKFYVVGSQTISKIDNNSPVDFFGDGDPSRGIPSIYDFFSNKKIAEYSRILWWPQYKVDLMSVWKANPTYVTLVEKPLEELPEIKQFFARLALIFINIADYNDEFKDVIATILNYFQQVGVQNFQDLWWKSLPMDNEIDDNILPVAFAELWMPLEDTKSVMNRLNKLFTDEPKSIGNFFSEIYTAKKSRFWLSPSYVGNVVRVDVNYFLGDVCGTPEEHYQYYWNALKDFKFRCHWGKYTPEDYGEHVKELYSSKYQDWMDIRKEMDPKQIFVTPYWRNRLSIPPLQ